MTKLFQAFHEPAFELLFVQLVKVITTQFNEYLLSRRGFSVWPAPASGRSAQLTLPSMRDSWWILLITLATLLSILAWTITQLG